MKNSQDPSSNNSDHHGESWLFSRTGILTLGALAILALLVYSGHSAHLLGYAPFLLILACPLMHVFMHGGHGSHGNHRSREHRHRSTTDDDTTQSP